MDGHRRQTLGAVSPNAMPNRRMSMAPNRVAAKGGMAKARQSVAPPGSAAPARQEPGRHANVRRSGHGKGPVDPRPITDKAWQLRCMKDVIAYVSARGYDKEIDLKRLASPRKADWEHLIRFMMRQVDPRWQESPAGANGKQSLEPDIEAFLKWTGYQHVPGKSALFTPGNASTWPQLLGVLRFLVDYLHYREKVISAPPAHAWENNDMAEFADFVERTYERYMAVDDQADARITEEYGASITARNAELRGGNAETAAENQALQVQLEAMRAAPAPLAAAQAARDEAAADRANWQHHIQKYQERRESQRQKDADWQAQVVSLQSRVAAAQEVNAELRQRVAEQPYTAEEAARMSADKINEGERLSASRAQVLSLEQAVQRVQMAIAKGFEELEGRAQEFNTAAERLGLLNAAGGPGKRARGVAYEARVDRDAGVAANFVSADLKGAVRAGLTSLRGDYQRAETELTAQRYAAEEALAARRDSFKTLFEETKTLDVQVKRLDTVHDEVKATTEQEVVALQAEADALATQAAELRGVTSDSVARSRQALLAKESELELLEKRCLEEEAQLSRELSGAFEALVSHQMAVRRRLESSRSTMEALREETATRIEMSRIEMHACAAA